MSLNTSHRHYALGVLTLTYVFNFVDRQLLAILVEPIKAEFNASDTQMGLLYGLSFALFYATLAIPIARFADRHNRRNIVAIAAAVWSAFTIACGWASSFIQLFVFRTGVAIGEAGGVPPSQSMISDFYPPAQRAKAMAVFSSATYLGSLIAFIAGAYIAEHYGWRMAFIVIGAPGIALAVLLRFTTREPIRGQWDAPQVDTAANHSFITTLNTMWHNHSLRFLLLGCGFASMAGYAIGYWSPSFLIRVHDMSLSKAGALIGITGITAGMFGSFFGAALCDRLAKRRRQWLMYIPAISLAASLPLMLAFLFWDAAQFIGDTSVPIAIIAFALASFVGSWWAAPSYVAVQECVPASQRTLACAILLFVMNLIGFGFGPFVVGALSDAWSAQFGDLAIRYALGSIMFAYLIAIVCYTISAQHFAHQQHRLNTHHV